MMKNFMTSTNNLIKTKGTNTYFKKCYPKILQLNMTYIFVIKIYFIVRVVSCKFKNNINILSSEL